MDRKRSLASIFAIIAVAVGAGHYVQSDATANATAAPPAAPGHAAKAEVPTALVLTAAVLPAETPAPEPSDVTLVPVAATPTAETAEAEPGKDGDCPVHLDLVPQDGAMLGITLVSPCHSDERVTLSHAGLTVSAKTSVTGSLFTSLPAMDMAGQVTVAFSDGTREEAAMPMPELADVQRFAVQWLGDDRFALNAFRNGATYGEPGHLTAQPLAMLDGITEAGAAVVALGDASAPLPLLAEVYTLPANGKATLTIEAQVTAQTCGRELLGETLDSRGGKVTVRELTLAMPPCDAIGDFIVLNNPRADLTLAASE